MRQPKKSEPTKEGIGLGAFVYPIPGDGKPLKTEHLRDLTLFILSQFAGARTRDWGFFLPRAASPGSVNRFMRGPKKAVVIDKLAVATPGGLLVTAEHLVSPPRPSGERARLAVVWVLPQYATEDPGTAPEVRLTWIEGQSLDPLTDVEIADVPQYGDVLLTAPLLSVDATPESHRVAQALSARVVDVADAILSSQQGTQFERLVLRAGWLSGIGDSTSPRRIAAQISETIQLVAAWCTASDPGAADVRAELESLVSEPIAAAAPDPEAVDVRTARAKSVTEPGASAAVWLDWGNGVAVKLERKTSVFRAWLAGARTELKVMNSFPQPAGGKLRRFRYELDQVAFTALSVRIRTADFVAPAIWVSFNDGPRERLGLSHENDEFSALLDPESKGLLDVIAPDDLDPVVTFEPASASKSSRNVKGAK